MNWGSDEYGMPQYQVDSVPYRSQKQVLAEDMCTVILIIRMIVN